MIDYRKKWIKANGPIPFDSEGRPYDIHHIDGNRRNNSLENLQCVSIEEHYEIHKKLWETLNRRRDLAAMRFLLHRLGRKSSDLKGYTLSEDTKEKIRKKLTGKKRPKEVVEKVRKKLKGRKQSEESIKNRSASLKLSYARKTDEEKKKINKKISNAHKGKIFKDSTKEKLAKINSKLSDKEVLEIDNLIKNKVNYKIISKKYNISLSQITAIKQRKTYKWLWN